MSDTPETLWNFFLNHLDFEKHVLPWVEARLLPSRSQSEVFNFLQTITFQNCRISSLQLKPDCPKIPEIAVICDWSPCLNSISPILQVWFVPSRSQSIFLELWQISRIKSSRMCFLHQNPDCTKVPKTHFHDNLIFKLDFLCSCHFGFYHQHVDRKLYSYEGEFD